MRQQKFRGNVFVANLPAGFTDEQLAQSFDEYGIVIAAMLARDAETGEVKNFGLVNLAPERAAAEAIAGMDGVEVEGRRIKVKAADPEMGLNMPQRRPPPRVAPSSYSRRPPPPVREFVVEHRPTRRRI